MSFWVISHLANLRGASEYPCGLCLGLLNSWQVRVSYVKFQFLPPLEEFWDEVRNSTALQQVQSEHMERVGETEMIEDINEQKQLLLWHVDFIVDLLNLCNFLEASQLVLLDTRQQQALVVFGQNHGTFYHKWLQGLLKGDSAYHVAICRNPLMPFSQRCQGILPCQLGKKPDAKSCHRSRNWKDIISAGSRCFTTYQDVSGFN